MSAKKIAGGILRFLTRLIVGAIGIYFLNQFLHTRQISASVGLNPVTLLTCATLGISGFALLYGILLYQNL